MNDAGASAEAELTLVWCDQCGREVLSYLTFAEDGESFSCVHCDGSVGGAVRVVRSDELDENGYSLVESGGCGRPDCGNGRCGVS